ncbi:MAG TPA: hypothetical protein VHH93_01595, partial [Gammaproteobacteria bacterium]|nr:hypothetical protein [Gammaproteobacteria bacterium]
AVKHARSRSRIGGFPGHSSARGAKFWDVLASRVGADQKGLSAQGAVGRNKPRRHDPDPMPQPPELPALKRGPGTGFTPHQARRLLGNSLARLSAFRNTVLPCRRTLT